MNVWRKCINRYQAISWLLLVMLLTQILFPLSFHFHHETNPGVDDHEHVIDSHILTDLQTTQHHAGEDTHLLKTTPDVIGKQNTSTVFVIALMISLLVVLSVVPPIISRRWQTKRNRITHFLYYDLAPPLRAPPAL